MHRRGIFITRLDIQFLAMAIHHPNLDRLDKQWWNYFVNCCKIDKMFSLKKFNNIQQVYFNIVLNDKY